MIGIVADDITGANDIGIMYGKAGLQTDVYPYTSFQERSQLSSPDVVILDTNSRLDGKKEAYDKVFQSTKQLEEAGCTQFFNKTCSVFRGNIGAEFDAMLDALEESFAVVVLGFPKNGRTTIHQEHFVYGTKLEDSNFRNDPVHPTLYSNIVEILQSQTERKVDHLDIETIRKGHVAIKSEMERKRENCHYLILDVEDQASLQEIAKAIHGEKIIAGASGVAEELVLVSERKQKAQREDQVKPEPKSSTGVLCAAGSLTPQTLGQIEYMKKQDCPLVEMETMQLFTSENATYLEELVAKTRELLVQGNDVLLYASNDSNAVAETKQTGRELGLTTEKVSRLVSSSLATVVSKVCDQTDINRFLVAGGETSASICKELSIEGMRVYKEIEPGLPSCINLSEPHYVFVLKSGSFGGPDFFAKALEHLRQ
ncbi:four-carbon acid sugar kinase family protein [Evansella tamaricis]|uniref:Four-carbon acid sugar kinase family protein n=1 Tax=Evansella tamaricis TaxID=2069301 RepID=A0ABS6JE29_9BACI|nr:four-carbon acid sugar kinase family protein [Evansella tamaricis]MBU9711660.1 four-carbon acid sugar kinase family protein [Evansella tamaricis]